MRNVGQSDKAVRLDLKHLQRILERCQDNTTRSPEKNARMVKLATSLVHEFNEEVYGEPIPAAVGSAPAPARKSA